MVQRYGTLIKRTLNRDRNFEDYPYQGSWDLSHGRANRGTLIIRIVLCGLLYYSYNQEPPKSYT